MQTIRQYITTGRHSIIMDDSNCTPYLGKGKGIVYTPYVPNLFGQDPETKARLATFQRAQQNAKNIKHKI